MPTLRMLEYLLAVADQGSFRGAARVVNATQPTLSQQLRLLEARLGVVLIDRDGMELTPIGREIAEKARRMLREFDDLKSLARLARTGAPSGILKLGVSPTIGPYLLPQVIAALHEELPSMRFYVREGIPDVLLTALEKGSVDLLLSPLPMHGAGCHVETLVAEGLRLCASLDHPLARLPSVSRNDLISHGVLSLEHRHHFHRQVASICEDLGMNILRDYEGTSLDSLKQMAASGLGLAILPELYLRSVAGGREGLAVLELSDYDMSREIGLLWRRESPSALAGSVLSQRLREAALRILRAEPIASETR